ncbi:MAG: ATP-dependent zinc metalloprotease FtsH [Candidatus Omnitrophica bacterium]|nr:ATP-dependent zinc metalloprotease FtsH [Candidatus Omnitrophota bacterium]
MERKPEIPKNNLVKGIFLWILVGIALFMLLKGTSTLSEKQKTISYSSFVNQVKKGNIKGTLMLKGGYVSGTLKNGTKFQTYSGKDPSLYKILQDKNVSFKVEPASNIWSTLLISVLPIVIFFFIFFYFISRQAGAESNRIFSFSRSKPVAPDPKNKITFADVAGSEEEKEELKEIIDFLKDPQKFQKLGGKIPRGVLLIGPPGTGKTLLAKAVAGEADVPFLGMSGSDFVEMFVGVGASRVRDLFRQAKRTAPSIIFIDEIDAVGRQRFAGLGGGHDEREQTLNQMLVEMDGFQTGTDVIVMAATNRSDVLDPALTRPGRFDRTIVVHLPDLNEREAIFKVHTKNKPLDTNVNLSILARGTPGLSGADIANIVNEAALIAARRNKSIIDMLDFEFAKDKVLMGSERKSLVISPEEKKIIAYHEAGHTIVQKSLLEANLVHKVTIIPRGRALGVTHVLPEKDKFIESNFFYKNTITGLLAGRVTEKLIFGKMFTGSENDLRVATEIAKKMVCEWGMSEKLGPVTFHEHEAVFLGRDIVQSRNLSEETNREIESEIKKILEDAEKKATEILTEKKDKLDLLAQTLIEKETLNSEEIDKILGDKNEPAV